MHFFQKEHEHGPPKTIQQAYARDMELNQGRKFSEEIWDHLLKIPGTLPANCEYLFRTLWLH
jgi:hypothetical protein